MGQDGGVYFPPIVDINPLPRASRQHGWSRIQINSGSMNNGYRSSCCGDPNATDNFVGWDFALGAGDWTMEIIYAAALDAGIMTSRSTVPTSVRWTPTATSH